MKVNIVNNNKETDSLIRVILAISLIATSLITFIFFFINKNLIAQGYLFGAIGGILYLRMQTLYVKHIARKDIVAFFIKILMAGRFFIIAALLYVAFKRTDLFNLIATVSGLFSIHLISTFVFAYSVLNKSPDEGNININTDKKKLMADLT